MWVSRLLSLVCPRGSSMFSLTRQPSLLLLSCFLLSPGPISSSLLPCSSISLSSLSQPCLPLFGSFLTSCLLPSSSIPLSLLSQPIYIASLCSAISWLCASSHCLRWASLASLSCTVSLAVAWTSESFVLSILIQLWRNALWSLTTNGLVSQMTHALNVSCSTPAIPEMPMAPTLHFSCVHTSGGSLHSPNNTDRRRKCKAILEPGKTLKMLWVVGIAEQQTRQGW